MPRFLSLIFTCLCIPIAAVAQQSVDIGDIIIVVTNAERAELTDTARPESKILFLFPKDGTRDIVHTIEISKSLRESVTSEEMIGKVAVRFYGYETSAACPKTIDGKTEWTYFSIYHLTAYVKVGNEYLSFVFRNNTEKMAKDDAKRLFENHVYSFSNKKAGNGTAQKESRHQGKANATKRNVTPLRLDLGGNVNMDFVWIEPLKCWVGKYEVTNEQYRRFKKNHNSGDYQGQSLNSELQPVVAVSYGDALDFAEWVDQNSALPDGFQARLPDRDEWTILAQCGDQRTYPWGNELPPKCGNYADASGSKSFKDLKALDKYNDGYPVTCPVEESGKNDWGLYGVGGNAWEWEFARQFSGRGYEWEIVRGAAWTIRNPSLMGCSNRYGSPSSGNGTIGFRLLLSGDVSPGSNLENRK